MNIKIILLALAVLALSGCKMSNPLIGIGPVSGSKDVNLGVEGTLNGRTVGAGVWIKDN
jgi:hypothetical protein